MSFVEVGTRSNEPARLVETQFVSYNHRRAIYIVDTRFTPKNATPMYNAFCLRVATEHSRFMSARARSGNQRADTGRRFAAARKAGARPGVESTLLSSPRKRNLVVCLLLAVVTLALYSPAVGHPFIFNYDDDNYVTNNAHVQAGLVWETVTWALTSTEYSNWHPLTWLSHALDCELYGLNPAGHHITNVLLHTLNVVVLFLLLARATGAAGRSLLVAALFAVHPFNVESVAWVAERKNVLSTLFFLLTLGAYGWYALEPTTKRYLAVVTLFVLGLASKPMLITLPCVLLLLDFWPLGRIQGWQQPSPARAGEAKDQERPPGHWSSEAAFSVPQAPFLRLVLEKLPLFALSAGSAAVTIFAQRSYGSMHLVLPLGVRLENAIYAYAMYVWKGFCPVRLAVFYPHPGATLAAWQLALAALFVLSVSALVWRQRASQPYLVTGWLWFLGTLVPVIGLVQVGEQALADRYAYIPLMGVFLMAVWGAADLADSRQLSFRSRAKIAAIVVAILVLFTCDQIRYWRSSADLWSHTVDVTKDNFFGEQNLGAALLASDRYEEALPHLKKAVKLRPLDPGGHLNLGGDFALSDRPRDAILEYETAIPLVSDPNMRVVTYETLGRLYSQLGQYSKARARYQQALRINPQQVTAMDGLAKVEFSDAIRTVAESPSGEGYLRLGQLLQQAGRIPEAQTAYQQALQLNPKLREARKALAALNGQQVRP
jgi:Flp pilus assembly protein TadD